MALDVFKEDVKEIKIRKNDYQIKVDKVIENNIKEEDISIGTLNLLDMEEEKKIVKTPQTIYLEEDDLKLLKAVSSIKNTTIGKTINNIIKVAVETTKASLPADFDIDKQSLKYDRDNKVKKNKK
ncbi:Uncharacterised protein [[Clostridium] sordellii]|uniref:Uncharacterized protein n=1 Tax=Paraclostridium sordellii TaxID=1505 RepID=A0ABM9RTJ1_PARSO|nr:hypothetical protein [Paeniclostridium sordellii]EPZ62116.1 hypothetical protein H477_5700 [[Clostridium] sordellii ATCC 9714] [Paeniclostridium sordellii ATCC 9714]CEJ75411.1 hypothetical protein ATCC9714_PCS200041 (plasmid) [[Clostridium] sordellii] [Paeniclostridium sordellii]CEN68003.1 Uncharacterised protein [[Clostridium] sordellii] [Paeniclostridium sordellii]CEN71306.1 Uncharacterised protein [[Clostridium] sordellii] [Paeniclostridium sordellii]CEO20765.1 Uncharacterised protein [[